MLVAVKLFIVLFVIVAGIGFINTDNYKPFVPPSEPIEGGGEWLHTPLLQLVTGSPAAYGVGGVLFAASLVFFAYIGFDVVATTAEEAANPQKDLPRGIIGSLVICTILYVAVALVITGMVKYNDINPDAALAQAFIDKGKDGYATLISAGAVAGLTTVVMTLMIGAVRVTFAMCRDNLLPSSFAHVSRKTGTPVRLTIAIGIVVAFVASLTPVGKLEEMVNIGTLTAFFLVSIAIPVLRKSRPDLKRSFKVPLSPFLPWLSAAICLFLMINLTAETWLRFLVWMALGFVIYFAYGYSTAGSAGARASRRRTTRADCPSAVPLHVRRRGRTPRPAAAPRPGGGGRGAHGGHRRVGRPDAARGGAGLHGAAHQRAATRVRVRPRLRSADAGRAARHRGRVRRELRGQGRPTTRACGRRHLRTWRPDVVVREETDFGSAMAAELAGVPCATLVILAAGTLARPDLVSPVLQAVRAEHGLAPDPTLATLRRDLVLSPFPPSFRDPSVPLPPTAFSYRPGPVAPVGRGPLVYVSLGTVFNTGAGDLFERLLAGLAAVPAEVLVTVGRTVDPADFGGQPAHITSSGTSPRPTCCRGAGWWSRTAARAA